MYSIEDKNQLIQDLKSAAKDHDGRQISRLVGHGEDLKIIPQTKAYTLRSLGGDLYHSNWESDDECAEAILEVVESL